MLAGGSTRRPPLGTGQFLGRADPQLPDLAAAADFRDNELNDGGVRVSLTTASNLKFAGSDLSPQMFIASPAHANDPAIRTTQGLGNTRKALNRGAGR